MLFDETHAALMAPDPAATWRDLVTAGLPGVLRGPFNREARRAAGYAEAEIAALEALAQEKISRRSESGA